MKDEATVKQILQAVVKVLEHARDGRPVSSGYIAHDLLGCGRRSSIHSEVQALADLAFLLSRTNPDQARVSCRICLHRGGDFRHNEAHYTHCHNYPGLAVSKDTRIL